jgi:hypothetical protein
MSIQPLLQNAEDLTRYIEKIPPALKSLAAVGCLISLLAFAAWAIAGAGDKTVRSTAQASGQLAAVDTPASSNEALMPTGAEPASEPASAAAALVPATSPAKATESAARHGTRMASAASSPRKARHAVGSHSAHHKAAAKSLAGRAPPATGGSLALDAENDADPFASLVRPVVARAGR